MSTFLRILKWTSLSGAAYFFEMSDLFLPGTLAEAVAADGQGVRVMG